MSPQQNEAIVVIGASAGGVDALQKVVAALPHGFRAPVFVVLHLPAEAESLLPQILSRAGKLPAVRAEDGRTFESGKIYVAPPDRHVLFDESRLRVVRGPKENRHRPSIDVTFRSAAAAFGAVVTGVLLTGADEDGTAGLKSIKLRGGTTIVQDPSDSLYPQMPMSAVARVRPDFVLPLDKIGPKLVETVGHAPSQRRLGMKQADESMFRQEKGEVVDVASFGSPSAFTCPDCNGTLWELDEGGLLRYRCRVGHIYSAGSMVQAQDDEVERALWTAIRALEESASISRRIGKKVKTLEKDMAQKAEERMRYARTIRRLLMESGAGFTGLGEAGPAALAPEPGESTD